jgi:cyclopropane-fatty-acyl-phospholipid synthase
MGLFSLEHSPAAYRADFVLYTATVAVLGGVLVHLLWLGPPGRMMTGLACVGLGWLSWSLIEYGLHRFVLHGLPPFQGWHQQHHARPAALIGSPTVMSAALIAALVFLPAWALAPLWLACALTLGVVIGYLGYAVVHHALHHWQADSAWLRQRKRWHARHHRHVEAPCCFGVTSGVWDRVFGSASPQGARQTV